MRRISLKRVYSLTCLALVALSSCSGFFFYPQSEHILTPRELGLPYEDVYFKGSQETPLHGWFLPATTERQGTILFLHGNAENISTHIASVFWLPNLGYDVYLPDYRGYGASSGTPDLPLILEDFDYIVEQVLNDKRANPGELVIFGQSIGGSISLYASAHSAYRKEFAGVVVESAFSSYPEIVREKLDVYWLTRPLKWPLSLIVPQHLEPTEAAPLISPTPLLILHGTADTIVPFHHGEDLFASANEPKQFWVIPGGGHIAAFRNEQYRRRFADWLHISITSAKAKPFSKPPSPFPSTAKEE